MRRKQTGFTLVEIMIVVAIIGLLAAIAVPSFMRARMRAQATTILNELRQVDAARDQYALENIKIESSPFSWSDLTPYMKASSRLTDSNGTDLLGNAFNFGGDALIIGSRLSVSTNTKDSLSDATGGDVFWGPYS